MNSLVIIPARGGSKGIPGKNIKELGGKPLICHTIDVAREIVSDADICVSTDDDKIREVVENYGLKVPFIRPTYLSTDHAGTYEVLLHALDFYERKGLVYDNIILLQCTSPFRTAEDVRKALDLYSPDIDMVVSVKESQSNPYFNLFEEDSEGLLRHSKGEGEYVRRQDTPKVWEYNGAVYVINPVSLKQSPLSKFKKIKKIEMDTLRSLDLDTPADWLIAETLISQKSLNPTVQT